MKRAFPVARSHPNGSSLGLSADLWWQGYGGLSLKNAKYKIRTLLKIRSPPNFIILHVGGNDLGNINLKRIRFLVEDLFCYLRTAMVDTKVIWSEVLPRQWVNGPKELEKSRKRLNTFAVQKTKQNGGFYLRHLYLQPFGKSGNGFYATDGVHLSPNGNGLFVDGIKQGLLSFLQGNQPWFQ